jgi:hypothetical protein
MTSRRQKIHAPFAVLILVALGGCSTTKPPLAELDAASRALGSARSAGATAYAAAEYRAAGQHFDMAQAAEGKGDYDEAAWLARESAADSELAIARTRLAREREAVDKLKQDNVNLDRELGEHAAATEAQP